MMSDKTSYATTTETSVNGVSCPNEIINDERGISTEIFSILDIKIHHFQQKIQLKPISLKIYKPLQKPLVQLMNQKTLLLREKF